MPTPSIYLNLEDDVSKIVLRVKREKSSSVVLVCPRRCFLFNDSINLRLLKKQTDLLGKEVYIMTMDELGQMYAKEAGFKLKFLSKPAGHSNVSDIRRAAPPTQPLIPRQAPAEHSQTLVEKLPQKISHISEKVTDTVAEIKNFVHKPKMQDTEITPPARPIVTQQVYPGPMDATPDDLFEGKRTTSSYKKLALGLVTVCVVLVLALVFLVLPHATVAVYPKTEPITRDWDIVISSAIHSPDAANLTLPGTAISQSFEEQQKFQTQGKKEVGNKASGTVQIYNFTKQPLNLKAGTTILTLGSKNYVLTQDLSGIRPTTYKNGATKEVDVASLTAPVTVMAQEGGDGYNVPAGTRLEITNQVFGSKPQYLFAKTVDAITGGTSRFLSVVTDQDLTAAQSALGDQAVAELKANLATQNLFLIDKSFVVENLGFSTDKPSGTETPSFSANLKVKITGLAISMDDLKKLITDRIGQTLNSDETVEIKDPDHQIINTLKTIDLASGTASLGVHFEGSGVMDVSIADIASELVNKNLKQANEILLSKKQIDKVEITLAPSWQKNFPLFASKIKVFVAK